MSFIHSFNLKTRNCWQIAVVWKEWPSLDHALIWKIIHFTPASCVWLDSIVLTINLWNQTEKKHKYWHPNTYYATRDYFLLWPQCVKHWQIFIRSCKCPEASVSILHLQFNFSPLLIITLLLWDLIWHPFILRHKIVFCLFFSITRSINSPENPNVSWLSWMS